MATLVTVSQEPILQFLDNNGAPLVGGQLTTLVGGINFPTYSEPTGTFALPNPIILNSRGEVATNAGTSSPLYVSPNVAYTFILQDSNGVTIWTAPNIIAAATTASVVAQITQSFLANLLFPQTAIETAANITPTNLVYQEGDIRRYGALTVNADNSAAINTALLISNAGGSAAFIPGGTWNITSTVSAIGVSSMYGAGQSSILNATGCNGITFGTPTPYLGSRFFRDFQLRGSNATASTFNGIVCDIGTGVVAAKVIGIQFSNLTITNFIKAVYVNGPYGLWESAFTDCFLYNNYHGYYISGQAVYFTIRGGVAQSGSITGGTGPRYGFYCADNAGGNGQSLHFEAAYFYGYDYNMSFTNVYFVTIEACDLSVYNTCGVYLSGSQGTFTLRDSWIQAAASVQNHCGFFVVDRGTQLFDKILVDGCSFFGNNGAGSCGIYGGHFSGPMTITNNTFGDAANSASWPYCIGGNTPGALGVSAVGTGGFYNDGAIIQGNTFYTITGFNILLYSSVNNATVGPNISQSGTPLSFSTPATTPPGLTYNPTGNSSGTTAMSGLATTVSLSYVNPNTAYRVTLSGNAAGFMWVSGKTTSSFVMNCSVTNTNAVDWSVSYS